MKIKIIKKYKSIKAPQEFELPDFVVLTGKNGSGKSHLMEAMNNMEYCSVSENGKLLNKIKYIGFNGLNPHIDENCDYLGLTSNRKQMWNTIKSYLQDFNTFNKHHHWSIDQYLNSDRNRKRILGPWVELVGDKIEDITEELFAEKYEISSDEIFSSNLRLFLNFIIFD